MSNVIPPMTDPLGSHWEQPPVERITVDDTHALMTMRDYQMLPEYSRSKPSGVYPGKMWKHISKDGQVWLCWYGIVDGKPNLCSNNARKILIGD